MDALEIDRAVPAGVSMGVALPSTSRSNTRVGAQRSSSPVPDTWGRVAGIDVPVLALTGALDASDHREIGCRLAELAPAGAYLEIPRAAHCPHLEQPAEYARTVRDFLRAHHL